MSAESTRNQRCSGVLAPPGKFWKFKYSRMQSRAIWTLKLPVIWCWKTLISNVCHVQCSCSSCSVSIFFCDILVWLYWSWAFFKWQRLSAHYLRFQKYPDTCRRGLSEWEFFLKSQLIGQSCFNFFIAPSPTLHQKTDFLLMLRKWNFASDKWCEHFRGMVVYRNGIFMGQILTNKVYENNGRIISRGKIPSVPKWEGRRRP